MADYDPANQGGAWEEEDEGYNEETEGFDGEAETQHSTPEDQEDHLSHDQTLHTPGDVPSDDAASEDMGDYDPEAVTSSFAPTPRIEEPAAAAADTRPSHKPTAKKPKTAGGFIVDSDSEDDDDNTSTPGSSGLAPPPQATHQRTASPLQNVTTISEERASSNQPQKPQRTSPAAPSSSHGQTPAATLPATNTQPQVVQDKATVLEQRVQNDPRGDMDAWLALIRECRDRSKLNDARKTYDRFLAVFPQAADIWADYIDMELGMNNFVETERLFGMCLLNTPNVNLWTKYLDYIRRRNDLNDSTGHARQVVAQSYEFVIDNIGCDKDSGKIWAEYIQFIKFGPGQVGGSSWQDQQKMDQLRKAYQRAICVPMQNVNTLWKEYDQFEMGLNKTTGRKFLAERSPAYMSAKSANTALENVTRGLIRTNLPRLPPAPGFDGDVEYMDQVETWRRWVAFEKSDPLEIKTDEPELFQKRILYAYKQALMALRFWPEMWVDAAEWCFENDISKDGADIGLDLLRQGITANPESVLLALKHADRIEATYPIEENDEAKIARGHAVREPYSKVLDTLYDLIKALKDREEAETARIKEAAAQAAAAASDQAKADYDDDEEEAQAAEKVRKEHTNRQLEAVKQGFAAQTQLLSRTVSFVWIALARAMRRIQGKGKPGTALGGMRQIFIDARPRGRLTSDVYVAMAQLEWTVYKEPAGAKIFERGAKLFPEDENFTVEYLKFLHSRDDFTNARVVFETVVNRLTQKPESAHKAKPLYAYFHKFESQFGELAQISKLEKRMAELFPEDPKLSHFTARFSTDKFDPIAARIIVSPATQLKPRFGIMSSIEQQRQSVSVHNSPRPQPRAPPSPRPQYNTQARDSPKRPFLADDFDDLPPRKAMRGEQQEFIRGASPLKGAAGRRLDQQRRGGASHTAAAPVIPRDITFLLGLIPPAQSYNSTIFPPSGVIRLLQGTHIPDFTEWRNREPVQQTQQRHNPQPAASHNRQPSSDYPPQYGFQQSRDSPNPQQGRPISPYTGGGDAAAARGRLAPGSTTYRQSSLRPGSSGSYEPPPAAYSQLGGHAQAQPQSHYFQGPPPQQGQYDGDAAAPSWPTYGAAPAAGAPQGYAAPAPTGYGQPPAQYQYQQY